MTFNLLRICNSAMALGCVICLSICFGEEAATKTVPVIKDGEAQVVEGFRNKADWIRHDLFVETEFDSDGDGKLDRMHVAVTRQKQTDTEGLKVPVIYVTSPYFAGTYRGDEIFYDAKQELNEPSPKRTTNDGFDIKNIKRPVISDSHTRKWVPRGYAVVHSCSPGTGLSQGCPTIGGKNESLAPKAVIDWLCGRAKGYTEIDGDEEVLATWCTGKIGMTGTSYNGTLPLAAATTGVEGLEAIIPIAPNTSYYHYYRSGGLVRHPGGYLGEDIDVLYDFVHSGAAEKREWCNCNVRGEMNEKQDRVTGDYNDFWASRDYLNQLEPMKAALLMSHGFNDWNVMPEHSIRIWQAVKDRVPSKLYVHQFGHGGPPPTSMMNRWFTKYLFGVDNGVEDEQRAWIVREQDKPLEPTGYDDYPHPKSQLVSLMPSGNGLAVGKLGTESVTKGETQVVIDDVQISGKELATSQQSQHRLLFVTPKLKKPIHLSGFAKMKVRVASDKPAVNLSVWLVSLPWNEEPGTRITANIITRGWHDPQNVESNRNSRPLTPGKYVDLEFPLQPDDQIIPVGQQIGLMVFASDKDFTLHPEPGTKLMVDLSGSSLKLPVVGGETAWVEAFE